MAKGLSFRWDAGQVPTLLSPEGEAISPELKHTVPMLNSAHAGPVVAPAGRALASEPGGRRLRSGGNSQPEQTPSNNIDEDSGRLFLHLPKMADCPACQHAKSQKRPFKRRGD